MHKQKEATARIAMWKELKIPTIYTMEASFCGADRGTLKNQHFTTEHLMNAGRKLLEALIVYCKIDVFESIKEIRMKGKKRGVVEEEKEIEASGDYQKLNIDDLQKEISDNKELIKMTEGAGDEEEGGIGSGSESDPSEDNLEEEEIARIVPIKIKKKKPGDKKKPEIKSKKKTYNINLMRIGRRYQLLHLRRKTISHNNFRSR